MKRNIQGKWDFFFNSLNYKYFLHYLRIYLFATGLDNEILIKIIINGKYNSKVVNGV